MTAILWPFMNPCAACGEPTWTWVEMLRGAIVQPWWRKHKGERCQGVPSDGDAK